METIRTVTFEPLTDKVVYRLELGEPCAMRGDRALSSYRFSVGETILFQGEDFGVSPCHAEDSDQAICALMGFLTLKPGDTDREYFDNYTPEQMEWAESYACEVIACDVAAYEEEQCGESIAVPWSEA